MNRLTSKAKIPGKVMAITDVMLKMIIIIMQTTSPVRSKISF